MFHFIVVKHLQEQSNCRILRIDPTNLLVNSLNVLHFVDYLGIDQKLEPHLCWIAREMLAAPMPPGAKLHVSSSGIIFFEDTISGHLTLEHPLTQRYLKVLEKARLETLILKRYKNTRSLISTQPDALFNQEFVHIQIPCQSCKLFQSTLRCEQCLMSFCDECFSIMHARGPRKSHSAIRTAAGSSCSSCDIKRPDVYCASCSDYLCFSCFEKVHKKGARAQHQAMILPVTDSDLAGMTQKPDLKCEECCSRLACFRCDFCTDFLCLACFWRLHFNGSRRKHTATSIALNTMCALCADTDHRDQTSGFTPTNDNPSSINNHHSCKATIFCEQCQELMCTECFTIHHYKGNRKLHLFSDASNFTLLLECLDPKNQVVIQQELTMVIKSICKIQARARGVFVRTLLRRTRNGSSAPPTGASRSSQYKRQQLEGLMLDKVDIREYFGGLQSARLSSRPLEVLPMPPPTSESPHRESKEGYVGDDSVYLGRGETGTILAGSKLTTRVIHEGSGNTAASMTPVRESGLGTLEMHTDALNKSPRLKREYDSSTGNEVSAGELKRLQVIEETPLEGGGDESSLI